MERVIYAGALVADIVRTSVVVAADASTPRTSTMNSIQVLKMVGILVALVTIFPVADRAKAIDGASQVVGIGTHRNAPFSF